VKPFEYLEPKSSLCFEGAAPEPEWEILVQESSLPGKKHSERSYFLVANPDKH